LAQELVDRFTKDMGTVLRWDQSEVRGLPASTQGLLANFEAAFADAISAALPDETAYVELSSRTLASYLRDLVHALGQQPLASSQGGALEFPEVSQER
jgi:hypothetical protein